jgi:sugar diacid utilization regulator
VRVVDLLEREELGLSVVWAEPAMLEHDVRGSYIIDLPEPGRFLSPGDIVITGGMWVTGVESAETYVSALAEKRVAALVLGRLVVGEIPDYIVASCRTRGIVLLTMATDKSFKAVTQYVESTVATADGTGTSRSGSVNRTLLDGLGSGSGAQGALRLFYDEFGVESWVLESGGEVSAIVGSAPSTEEIAAVWNRVLWHRGDPVVITDPDGRVSSVWPLLAEGVRPIGFLVCAGDHTAWPPDLSRVARTMLLVVRVELELANSRREAEQEHAREFVQLLISDAVSPGEASARLRLLGADPLLPMTAISAQVDDQGYPARAILETLTGMVEEAGRVMIGCELGDEAIVLISGVQSTPEELIAFAEGRAERQRALLGDRRLRVGVSEATTSLSQLSSAVASARARMRSAAGDGTIVWSTRSTPASHEALLDMLPDRVKSAYGRGLLAPLTDYDVRHGSDLVQTLRVFLEANGAWQQAAASLHVHVNTLRYRMGRIEDLTRRDVSSMRDRVDLFLALACVEGPER